jgi:hypothetical protein
MNEQQRQSVFEYIYQKADENHYMAMGSPASTAFQDQLEIDNELESIAGEKLTRKYIKDTVLNRYSKDRRYIDEDDIISAIHDVAHSEIIGNKALFQTSVFHIVKNSREIECASASFDQWETSIKRLGKWNGKNLRFVFLTCGGVAKSAHEIAEVKDTLRSLGVFTFIVKPNDATISFDEIFKIESKPTHAAIDHELLVKCIEMFSSASLKVDVDLLCSFASSLLTKRFCILTGLAGSGKTKLAEAFAMWLCESPQQYRIVAVGADWTSNENLLGYADALQPGQYRAPVNGVLELLLRAQADTEKPYFLILDEMNLSHVERYFADFLSAMESDNAPLSLHGVDAGLALPSAPGGTVPAKLPLPHNLFIIGTVNVDETTYMFSPKVLDRANVIEFRATKDQMAAFLDNPTGVELKALKEQGVPFASAFLARAKADADVATLTDKDGNPLNAQLKSDLIAVFSALESAGVEFGFRTAKEIARFMVIHKELSGEDWVYKDALDAQVLQKLMPKLHGSARKLECVLKALADFAAEANRDLPLTREKIKRMQSRLERDGFTSFAEA